MQTISPTLSTTLLLAVVAAPPAAALDAAPGLATRAPEADHGPTKIVRAAELRGRDVENAEGRIGDVVDLYVNPRGQIVYYVVELASTGLSGARHFAVPAACLTPDPEEPRFLVDLSVDAILAMEPFELDEQPWPAVGSTAWCDGVDGETLPRRPAETRRAETGGALSVIPARAWNLEALLGTDITTPGGERLGRLAALGVDLLNARVGFWLLSSDGGADLVAVPWEALSFLRDPEAELEGEDESELEVRWVIDATDSQIERAEEFDPDDEEAWSRSSTPEWLEVQYSSWSLPLALYYRHAGIRAPVTAGSPLGRGQ